jgi:hypothetical protein
MFENNPNWVYIAPDEYTKFGFWAKVGGRTEAERDESRDRLEWQSTNRAMAHTKDGLYIHTRNDGMYGLFASKPIDIGAEILNICDGTLLSNSDIYTIEVDAGHYMHKFGRYTNHSCDPTATVDRKSGLLIANQYIAIDGEITFDYLTTERDLKADFDCRCGADNCVGTIRKGVYK